MPRIIVLAGDSLGQRGLDECWQWCNDYATAIGEPVLLATMDEAVLPVPQIVFGPGMVSHGEIIRPATSEPTASGAPMSAAPFVYREDGAPDWGSMWTSFCELALYGGPPHRGEDSALRASGPTSGEAATTELDAVYEIQRGIYETTGLISLPHDASWLAVQCDSTKMAAWLCATIVLENVEARFEGDKLLVPARSDFRLKDEVKSVITVVAKTHHYWQSHVQKISVDACPTVQRPRRPQISALLAALSPTASV